jgi:putative DNA primase/helicase
MSEEERANSDAVIAELEERLRVDAPEGKSHVNGKAKMHESTNENASMNLGSGKTHHHDDEFPHQKERHEVADDPHRLARLILEDYQTLDGPALCYWREEFHAWNGLSYQRLPDKELKARACERIKKEFDRLVASDVRLWEKCNGRDEKGKAVPAPVAHKVTTGIIANTVQALAGMTLLPAAVDQPAWLRGSKPFPANEILVCRNQIVHLPSLISRKRYDHSLTPRLFSPNALTYDFDPHAPKPVEWLTFLAKLWSKDQQSIDTLQEWFGYSLLPDTRQQKILMVVGPKRSGKGTIARVLRSLVGIENTCAPTLAGLGTNFGLSSLLGKTVAIISDARLSGRSDAAIVVERLLSISGEDAQTIDRKHLPHVTTKLPVRFTILTNELPKLNDPSGAVVGRLIVLRQTESWYGREDVHLTDRLLTELPSILLWAIEGWKRLHKRGHFVQPESGKKLIEDLEDLSSPIGAFIRECCVVKPGCEVFVRDLYDRWKRWGEDKGRKDAGTEQVFGRDLKAAVPTIDVRQPRSGGGRVRVYEGIRLRDEQDNAQN